MARGRFISRSISISEQIDDLIDREGFEAGLLITWMIPHLDVEGRMKGGPKTVKAAVCPLRDDIDKAKVEAILTAADDLGIIRWYEVDGERFIWFPKFLEHQQGLRPKREGASTVPEFLPEYSGTTPGVLRGKLSKEKTSKGKGSKVNMPPAGIEKTSIQLVVDYYRDRNPGKGKHIKPGHADWKRIASLLADFSVDDLKLAVDGNLIDDWHVANRKHSAEYVFRNATKVEGFIDTARKGTPGPQFAPTRKKTWMDGQRELMEDIENATAGNGVQEVRSTDG
jgi:hypothetical protein